MIFKQPVQNDISDSKVQYLLCQMMQGVKQYALFTWIGSKVPADRLKASETHKTALHRHLSVRSAFSCGISRFTKHNLCLGVVLETYEESAAVR
jgi:hypothetical protein